MFRKVTDDLGNEEITHYAGAIEVRQFGTPTERVIRHLHSNLRETGEWDSAGNLKTTTSVLHRNHLSTVVHLTTGGTNAQRMEFYPYGSRSEGNTWQAATRPEDEGFIGEQHDEDAGLIYLNARYYDPDLGRFIQPDWWEVTIPGVGTNRYVYSLNDPVNLADPGGNVPYNPGGYTSTGWHDLDGDDDRDRETYNGRHDRGSSDYLDQDGDGQFSVGVWESGFAGRESGGGRASYVHGLSERAADGPGGTSYLAQEYFKALTAGLPRSTQAAMVAAGVSPLVFPAAAGAFAGATGPGGATATIAGAPEVIAELCPKVGDGVIRRRFEFV